MRLKLTQALSVTFALLTIMAGCVEQDAASQGDDDRFPDVGIGCFLERVGDDQWAVWCPPEDASVGQSDSAEPIAEDVAVPAEPDASPADIDAGVSVDAELRDFECEPALSLIAPRDASIPYRLTRLQAEGGTGSWRFELVENNSGAIINETSGVYLAGAQVGTTDRVRLSDDGCLGEAFIEVRVVAPMDARPLSPELQPGERLTFEVDEGSGDFQLVFESNQSDGSILGDLTYEAGSFLGTDVLKIEDISTGDDVTILVNVRRDITIEAHPKVVYLPVGAWGDLSVQGGSGLYDFEGGDGLEWDHLRFFGQRAGRYSVRISDRAADRSTEVSIVVMESLSAEQIPSNDHTLSERIHSLGDVNGDGFTDVMIAQAESDALADNGGGLYVFLSDDGSYGPAADQQFFGTEREDELGRGATAADLNGDGLIDLVYGVRLADTNGVNSGSVLVHFGQPGGLFSEAPNLIVDGPQNDAQVGMSLAACDFNGDGFMDLAIGAYAYEDRDERPTSWNQGAILIHLGHPDGLLPRPDQTITGQLPDDRGIGRAFGTYTSAMIWRRATLMGMACVISP